MSSDVGQGGDVSRSFYKSQRQDSKMSTEKQSSKDPRAQLHEQDMEIGFEDNPLVQTFEGIEQKFHDEIMKLAKEQYDAEDAENARHREKVNEVNTIYQEKLASLRVQHASRRDEFLRRESQARQHQYQQAGATQYQNPNAGTRDPHPQGYGGSTEAAGEAPRRGFASGQLDSYRERAQYLEGASRNSQGSTRNNHGYESSRGPYPGGRVYNNNNNSRFY
ncbi:hypothetical protein GIB67_034374 [Kingdonia uniflora]|uniref:Uncharacterized protein n=1 Tax=Kingdonia uniflora TaxID=39325 RepID=A0A7J7NSM9_9MAGN|nr:hypothetical protein GIB67_034374 [Kingdonia uniflora]